jgi:aryl-alcohol dehydrogenase-like predicted oxidoreductase
VGKAIEGRRHEVFVATKCGRRWGDDPQEIFGKLKAESVREEAEDSLRRLNTEVIDLYQMHWPDPQGDIEEGWAAMADLVTAGKVRYIGVSNFNEQQLERIQPIRPVASLQPPYNMLRRDIEDRLLSYCAAHSIGVVVYSPMQAGLLAGRFTKERAVSLPQDDWRSTSPSFKDPELSANLELVENLRRIARRSGRTVAQLAIAWVLRRPEVTAAIVGARRPVQIVETAAAGDWKLSADDIREIDGLLEQRDRALGAG